MKKNLWLTLIFCMGMGCASAQEVRSSLYEHSENYVRAQQALDNENYTEALKYYELELKEHPRNSDACIEMSIAYASSLDYDNALRLALQAVEVINPEDKEQLAGAHGECAYIYGLMGDLEQAVAYAVKATELNPEDTRLQLLLVDFLRQKGRYEESAARILETLETDDTDETFYAMMETSGQEEQYLLKGLAEMAADDTDDASWLYFIGMIHWKGGRYEQSVEVLQQALSIVEEPMILMALAGDYEGLGNKAKAKELMQQAIDQDPSPENCYEAARMFARMGDTHSCREYLRLAVDHGFDDIPQILEDEDLHSLLEIPGFVDELKAIQRSE